MGNALGRVGRFCMDHFTSLAAMGIGFGAIGYEIWTYEDPVNFGFRASVDLFFFGAGAYLLKAELKRNRAECEEAHNRAILEDSIREMIDNAGFCENLFRSEDLQRMAENYARETGRLEEYQSGLEEVRASKFRDN